MHLVRHILALAGLLAPLASASAGNTLRSTIGVDQLPTFDALMAVIEVAPYE
ncbi:hypothetical protein UVI_02003290 [Ustilaginoidea virens]|uniref:Uncharacterized protein n=1 Tax=Ustilaginoidea virens TaxID=1159556 RepID=A0A1B5L0W5_USTVR|nr:hypothetical protein UVI_02003290 [Ustilaginoidea virens]